MSQTTTKPRKSDRKDEAQLEALAGEAAERREEAEELLDITDDLLDEIEAVLMSQETVDEFVQKGGE